MIKEALKYLVDLGNPPLVNIDERKYSAVRLDEIYDPQVQPLMVNTLTGLVDYINEKNDEIESQTDSIFIHVAGYDRVDLYGSLFGPWKQRNHYINVSLIDNSPFRFNEFYNLEDFIIELQAKFVSDKTTKYILKCLGNTVDENVTTYQDDGTSQGVIVKSGIRKEEMKVPNPVELRPYRTFPEIEQPSSKFVLRVKTGHELPRIALFDADGGQWKLEAIQLIKAWLANKLPEITIIA